MTDNWEGTRAAWRKLKATLAEADSEERLVIGMNWTGFVLMVVAVFGFFGWWGALFLFGSYLWLVK
jgi:hypothetical protein